MAYQKLDWDTDFFGVSVARINEPGLVDQELSKVLIKLRDKDVDLVYWSSNRKVGSKLLGRFGGLLSAEKVTFIIDLACVDQGKFTSSCIVEPFSQSMRNIDFQALAIQSGEFSRFSVDKNIPQEKFDQLYQKWIIRSLRKEIADEVLAIREGECVVGMVTLGTKGDRGDIGLLAVDSQYRGKQLGVNLVNAALKWFIAHGYNVGQVVTQGANIPACNLYKKTGYSVESVEYFYHFWL
ncbi:GNAT family N-acetyltransferase [Aliagarivorans taiwanensis]|uniref:GNAT family N-acetyltransferase n=1 Tax=Aliagarivorans taiwanensis TaxID=561966 RepID=UPI00047DFFE9|nr:GNAT family N-acetyltransferase [Aliagarivorans taiwanensis]